jgi:hypothetical protein
MRRAEAIGTALGASAYEDVGISAPGPGRRFQVPDPHRVLEVGANLAVSMR